MSVLSNAWLRDVVKILDWNIENVIQSIESSKFTEIYYQFSLLFLSMDFDIDIKWKFSSHRVLTYDT